ncbi:GNAT family N-acetyltransferase [Paeniglutamicibacter sp. MACA_103]|uniref:GNAT family N-acetyltransferase n=1 Tax=Paeniglutamicibacter sp. MACA_103 TaxID=3377337 RepID=UPI003892EE20
MRILLQTARLALREFTADDAGLLVELDSDPRVMRYITDGVPTSREEIVAEHIPAYLGYHRQGPDFGFWVAQLRETGDFVGWFHLRPEPGHRAEEPELGYRLKHAFWGLGLATEGSRALIDHAFTARSVAVTRVFASTMAVNIASRMVMEKCGMDLVRHFVADWPVRIAGDEFGDVEYAITRESWLASREGPSSPGSAG